MSELKNTIKPNKAWIHSSCVAPCIPVSKSNAQQIAMISCIYHLDNRAASVTLQFMCNLFAKASKSLHRCYNARSIELFNILHCHHLLFIFISDRTHTYVDFISIYEYNYITYQAKTHPQTSFPSGATAAKRDCALKVKLHQCLWDHIRNIYAVTGYHCVSFSDQLSLKIITAAVILDALATPYYLVNWQGKVEYVTDEINVCNCSNSREPAAIGGRPYWPASGPFGL